MQSASRYGEGTGHVVASVCACAGNTMSRVTHEAQAKRAGRTQEHPAAIAKIRGGGSPQHRQPSAMWSSGMVGAMSSGSRSHQPSGGGAAVGV